MLEYYPWSKKVLQSCIDDSKSGKMPTLDLELSAICTGASCIYCDSKPGVCSFAHPDELDYSTLKKAILEGKEKGLRWVYTCGLGEPLEDPKFWGFVELLHDNNISLSMFSNGLFIQDLETAKKLKDNNVFIILKMDTFDESKYDTILGRSGAAKKIYKARDLLLEAGYGPDGKGYTSLAFSIVPTSLSIEGIPDVIAFCDQHGIFASVGELEQAGEVINNNLEGELGITEEQTHGLKCVADTYYDGPYMRPICPCIMTGVHIDNFGKCVVDNETGLNCKWFLLKDPKVAVIGSIHESSLSELYEKAVSYRNSAFSSRLDQILCSCDVSYEFGGCGGNPRDIISLVRQELII